MPRRSTHVLFVIALLALAGCLGSGAPGATPTDRSPTDTPTDPAVEALVFDHGGIDDPVIEGGLTHDEDYTTRFYVTNIATEDATDRFDEPRLPADARAFVRNTSFDTSSLVVIQAFPASSTPDYRVESVRREDGTLQISINDSSQYATGDITVETLLLRVEGAPPERVEVTTEDGVRFDTDAGVVTVTPEPTPTPEPEIELPYAGEHAAENVEEPRGLRLQNAGTETNGYRLTVVYHDRPGCLEETPACDVPSENVTVLERTGKLQPGTNLTIDSLAARKGIYTIEVAAEVPTENGSRRTVTDSLNWNLTEDAGDLRVTITDEAVRIVEAS